MVRKYLYLTIEHFYSNTMLFLSFSSLSHSPSLSSYLSLYLSPLAGCGIYTGSRILNVDVPKDQMYPMKLKGISICFSMLKAALCGSYVNFGVFRLYGDEALDNALNTFVKLLLSIPQSDLLVSSIYVKV